MKKYYASADELGIKKGQQVWPREEALKMNNGWAKGNVECFSGYAFWGEDLSSSFKRWEFVCPRNEPICIETPDEPQIDLFREWLVSNRTGYAVSMNTVLGKYDEINGIPAPQEPKPLFEVGEKVNSNFTHESVKVEICDRRFKDGKWVYIVFSKTKETKMIYNEVPESELRKLPKTKFVFSLEKWVEWAMKENGAKFVVDHYDIEKRYVGMTQEEVCHKYGLVPSNKPIYVEVEVKE